MSAGSEHPQQPDPSGLTAADLARIEQSAPASLRQLRQWVCWRVEVRGSRKTKVPVNPHNLSMASTVDPSTWASLPEALECCRRHPLLAGVGFVFTANDPYCGIDLDRAIDPSTNSLMPWALEIVQAIHSYTEVSPSGLGVKIFLQGKKVGRRCRTAIQDGAIEIYDHDRYFTLTGCKLDGVPQDVMPRQSELANLEQHIFGRAPASQPAELLQRGPVLDDETILSLAEKDSFSGSKFQDVWSGRWSSHPFPSPSEADLWLVSKLAYYTKDAAQIDRMFRRSSLMRPKWDDPRGQITYGEMTIASALRGVTRQYQPRAHCEAATSHQRQAPPPAQRCPPSILIENVQLSDLTSQAQAALTAANSPPSIFVRAGQLARVIRDETGTPTIEPYDRVRMRCRLSEVAHFYSLRKVQGKLEQVGINPPLALAENVLALGHWDYPPLAGITRSPILRTDGSICTTPGYDAQSRLYYAQDPGLTLPPIPERPSAKELQASVDMLTNLIGDFPFADQASRANALSILFSILMRPVIAGHIPLVIVDAPVQGSGKTLLVSTLGTIAVGGVAGESIPSKQNDDEWRKKITSILLGATPFVLLDNIPDNTTIHAPALAAVLTTHEWSDRLLGRNDSVRLPSRAVWAATGNNLRVAGDMPRRSYSVRLDANAERPWERTGFRIAGLDAYVASHRGTLLAAAFTIIRAWYVAGQPRTPVRPFGSFDDWASTIGSVLAHAGIEGFLANLDQTRTVQDEDTQQWKAFFDAWWESFGSVPVTVEDLSTRLLANEQAMPDALMTHRDRGEGSLRRSLGRHLSRFTGRLFNQRKLCDAGQNLRRKVRAWRLEPQAGSPNDSNNPA